MDFGYKKLYLDGKLVDSHSQNTKEIICPGTEKSIGKISWAQIEDAQNALSAAQEGFKSWSKTSIDTRIEWMEKLRLAIIQKEEILRSAVMGEMGKTWDNTQEDFKSITDSLKYYSEEILKVKDVDIVDLDGTHTHTLISQPLGVVVAFLAYNFPLLNLGFKLGPALAAGCSIIIKPSEYSPLSAYLIGEICHEIDFPKGVINILCGDIKDVGIPLSMSKIPRLITMIGSTATAQKLIEQSSKSSIKNYSMECGGNAPFIVFDDANIDLAVDIAAALKIGNTGQICVAPNRYYIHEDVLDQFVEQAKNKLSNLNIGFGREAKPDMGPLANRASVDRMNRIVAAALDQGGELLLGGKELDKPGYFFEPTIIRLSDPNAVVLQEEIFGPIMLIVPFSTKEEVLEFANDTDTGLSSFVFSKDEEILDYFADQLQFGEVQLNGVKYDIYLPHFGIKNSGIGMDCSEFALDDYLVKKRVTKAVL